MSIRIQKALAGVLASTAIALVSFVNAAAAQTFPQQKPITLIVPFAPGGGNDILARAIAPKLGQLLGQTVVIENKPGAGGSIGTDLASRAAPDGHTIVIASSQVTMNPFLDMKVPFKIESDFEPLALIASVPLVLVAAEKEPYKNFQEFLAYTRANPGKVSYSSPGNGTPQHMAGEVFAKMSKTDLLHVPYRGTGPSIADLLGGQIQVSFATYASVAQHIQTGKLRALGIAGQKRTPLLPNLQTFAEFGMKGYDASLWYCLLAPAKTPKAIVDKINQAAVVALRDPALAKQLADQGFETQTSSPAELRTYIGKELARWERVIKDNQIKVTM